MFKSRFQIARHRICDGEVVVADPTFAVGAAAEDDWDRRGCCFGCKRRLCGERRRDDGDMTANKVSRQAAG